MDRIGSHFDLRVYQSARASAIKVFTAAKIFPGAETLRFGSTVMAFSAWSVRI
jgi:hypothetical protein